MARGKRQLLLIVIAISTIPYIHTQGFLGKKGAAKYGIDNIAPSPVIITPCIFNAPSSLNACSSFIPNALGSITNMQNPSASQQFPASCQEPINKRVELGSEK